MNISLHICIVLLIIFTADVYGRKGGSIGRSSISRTNVRITQTKVKVRYGSSYRPWSSGYNNWWYYGNHGHIYGFVWYTRTSYYRDHPNKEPTICRNEFDNTMDNGTHYEWFICPTEKHTSDYHYCCGETDKQHCCRFFDDGWRLFGMIITMLFMICLVVSCCYCCCCRKRTTTTETTFQRVFSRKISSRSEGGVVPLYPVQPQPAPMPPQQPIYDPLQPPATQMPGFMPMPQPQAGFQMPGPHYMHGYDPAGQYPGAQYFPEKQQPHVAPTMPGIPPYPVEGGDILPPSYTPYQVQPTAPSYPSADPNLPYPPSNPTAPMPYHPAPYPIGPGCPSSPPPPYGQM